MFGVGGRQARQFAAFRRLTGASWRQELIKITNHWQDGIIFDNRHKFQEKHVQKNGMKSSNSGSIFRAELSWNVHGLASQLNLDVDNFCLRSIWNELDICYISIDNLAFLWVLKGMINFRHWTFVAEVFSWIFFNLTIFIFRPTFFNLKLFMILLFYKYFFKWKASK